MDESPSRNLATDIGFGAVLLWPLLIASLRRLEKRIEIPWLIACPSLPDALRQYRDAFLNLF